MALMLEHEWQHIPSSQLFALPCLHVILAAYLIFLGYTAVCSHVLQFQKALLLHSFSHSSILSEARMCVYVVSY
jgi:hypothetical protein